MSFFSQIRGLIRPPEPAGGPRIAVFGDSHTAALISAKDFPERKGDYEHIRIYRLLKEKDGKAVGDSTLEDFCSDIRGFRPDDLVFSAVGGNQYAVISTVRDPISYDFMSSPDDRISPGAELVPFRTVAGYISKGVRGAIGPVLKQIREATSARVFHLAPPPPKKDNKFIRTHFESRFADLGIENMGPTPAGLRLKCWQVQLDCLAELCRELGITLVRPPSRGVTAEGYLAPRYYAKDVTHANRRYGEIVLRQMLELAAGHGEAEA
jgi:hypothetical protein